jgi:predicted ATP-dependent endonuclease of OLD family
LNHDVCKYILFCLVHKENKDITTKPTQQPSGHTRIEARGRKEKALEVERAVAKADRPVPVEKYGDVDHQLKKIRVEGMQSQVLKNCADEIKTNVDSIRIRSQIELMQQMENVYVRKMGQTKYDDMIVSLINQLPSMKSSIDFSDTNTSSGNPESPYGGVSTLESPF